jgi:hypothetical protein
MESLWDLEREEVEELGIEGVGLEVRESPKFCDSFALFRFDFFFNLFNLCFSVGELVFEAIGSIPGAVVRLLEVRDSLSKLLDALLCLFDV